MKKKGMLLSSIAMVMISIIALTTASFAWFTESKTATVGDVNVDVVTKSNLYISTAESGTFASTLTADEFKGTLANNSGYLQSTDKQDAATPTSDCIDSANGNVLKLDSSNTLQFQNESNVAGNKMVMKATVWLKSTSAMDVTVAITDLVSSKGATTAGQKTLENAIRVAFVYDTTLVSYNPYGEKAETLNGNQYSCEYGSDSASITSLPLMKLVAGTAQKLDIYIWIEGNDKACTDYIATGTDAYDNLVSGGTFVTKLAFTGAVTTP